MLEYLYIYIYIYIYNLQFNLSKCLVMKCVCGPDCPVYFNAIQLKYTKKGHIVSPSIHQDKVKDVFHDELYKMFTVISELSYN